MKPPTSRRKHHLACAAVPPHVLPSQPLAPDALLPGDPGRAMALAQLLLEKPLMSNHNRGLWGYTGETPEGRQLTVQSTGMGGPSAAIVLHELAELGVRRAIRVGTCGALDGSLELGAAAARRGGAARGRGQPGPRRRGARSRPIPSCWAGSSRRGPARRRRSPPPTSSMSTRTRPGAAGSRRARPRWRWRPARSSPSAPGWGWPSPACWWSRDVFPGGERVRIEPEALEGSVQEMGRAAAAALAG